MGYEAWRRACESMGEVWKYIVTKMYSRSFAICHFPQILNEYIESLQLKNAKNTNNNADIVKKIRKNEKYLALLFVTL